MVLKQRTISIAAATLFVVMSIVLGVSIYNLQISIARLTTTTALESELRQLSLDLAASSALLTNEARRFAVTGDPAFLKNYWDEIDVTKTGVRVLNRLQELNTPADELQLLATAKANSDALVATETRSMRLALEAQNVPESAMPVDIAAWKLSAEDQALSAEEKQALAVEILFNPQYDANVAIIMGPTQEFRQKIAARAVAAVDDAKQQTTAAEIILVILAVLIPISIGAILWIFQVQTSRPILSYIATLNQRAGQEQTRLQPTGTEELRQLAAVFNDQMDTTERHIADNQSLVESLGVLIQRVAADADDLHNASAQLTASADQSSLATQQIAQTIGQVAQGNADQSDRVGRARLTVEGQVKSIANIADGAQRQMQVVEQVKKTLEQEMATVIQQVSQIAGQSRSSATSANQASELGGAAVGKMVNGIHAIAQANENVGTQIQAMSQRSDDIDLIVRTIDEIAERTNLLALNAAIEAARAGEHGKGFAVVADEVRKLAERSALSTREISELIGNVKQTAQQAITAMKRCELEVEQGLSFAGETEEALTSIQQEGKQVADHMAQLVQAVQSMNENSEKVRRLVEDVTTIAQQSGTATEQLAGDSEQILMEMESVAAVSEQNSAAAEEVSAGAEEMSSQVGEVVTSASDLAQMAVRLKELVSSSQFGNQTHPNAPVQLRATSASSSNAPTPRKLVPRATAKEQRIPAGFANGHS